LESKALSPKFHCEENEALKPILSNEDNADASKPEIISSSQVAPVKSLEE